MVCKETVERIKMSVDLRLGGRVVAAADGLATVLGHPGEAVVVHVPGKSGKPDIFSVTIGNGEYPIEIRLPADAAEGFANRVDGLLKGSAADVRELHPTTDDLSQSVKRVIGEA